ncbi:magnesium/cobalt transporter CorA [Dysgonomonas sp. BGC7]|uniref:magnesium/cobalt transporter CorA n=1 Tax=Dysgonomonas sp. BGC7 TaxID=1658008 RepID=UPI00067FF7CA|nr:magnesium/cobalt transporter CorA [Dysgonomonas sp. BGC7]MBD8388055.1 magnesium/cobalt transporter CorA [Dysgonomonas sp. BGC7]
MNKKTQRKLRRKIPPHNYLSVKASYLGDKDIPMSVELIQYDSMRLDIKNISLKSLSLRDSIDNTRINWFKITGISDVALVSHICQELGLHTFDVKDMLSDQQVVKVVAYEKVTFILLSSFYSDESKTGLDDMQVAFILGDNFVVSFQEATYPVFDEIKTEIEENNAPIRRQGADFLLYILLNAVNYSNVGMVMGLEERLSEIEDQLIEGNGTVDMLQFLHSCRVDYMHIKRSVISLREEYVNLLHNTNNLIKEGNVVYFNDFDDRMRTTLGNLSSFHESLSSLLDLYYNNNNLRMNEIIKRLTIVSTIFIPLTFMVGVWGMNFKFMPEIEWEYGYFVSWVILGLIALCTYLWMRKQRWF